MFQAVINDAPQAVIIADQSRNVFLVNPAMTGIFGYAGRLTLLGYRVVEADNGPAALALVDAGTQIDLIFSDVVMPGGMTGYELAHHARQHLPAVKVLLTSGYDAEVASALDTTGSELRVLRKPYRQADLARVLRDVLRD